MPVVRRRKPVVPPANAAAAPSPLIRPVLPQRVVPKPPPPKVPFPTLADNQTSIVLNVPTVGRLPPVSRTIVASPTHGTIVSRPTVQPVVARHRPAPIRH